MLHVCAQILSDSGYDVERACACWLEADDQINCPRDEHREEELIYTLAEFTVVVVVDYYDMRQSVAGGVVRTVFCLSLFLISSSRK